MSQYYRDIVDEIYRMFDAFTVRVSRRKHLRGYVFRWVIAEQHLSHFSDENLLSPLRLSRSEREIAENIFIFIDRISLKE